MNNIYIRGLGLLSPVAGSPEELLQLAGEPDLSTKAKDFSQPLDFSLGVPSSKVRRASRYAKMAVAAAGQAIAAVAPEDKEDIGTIFLTGYGSVESYASFTDSVVEGTPSLASPTVFSYTVPNSCLGQTCIAHGFRGPSTMLLGGDPAEYSALLLSGDKAKYMLCGAVEEGNAELKESLQACGILSENTLADGAAMLLLSMEPGNEHYGRLIDFASISLPAYPYVNHLTPSQQDAAITAIKETLVYMVRNNPPDVLLTTRNGSYFDAIENEALSSALGSSCEFLHPKELFGEALNASYLESIAFGAALLHLGRYRSILATGIDVHGNYLAARLEA